jgi:hypothetical protein
VPLGDTRCPGVSEPGLGSPLPHQGRATPRLVGSPAGACASEAGVFGTQRIVRTRSGRHEGLSPPFFRAVSRPRAANEQQREKSRRSTARAKVREDKRRARGKRPRVVTITVAELTCRGFSKNLGSESEGVLGRRDPCLSRGTVRESVSVSVVRTSKLREVRPAGTTGHQRWSCSSPSREETPEQRTKVSAEARTAT